MKMLYRLMGWDQPQANTNLRVRDKRTKDGFDPYRVSEILDEIVEARKLFTQTFEHRVEQEMAARVCLLTAEFEDAIKLVSERSDIESLIDSFWTALFSLDSPEKTSHIEGRIIWTRDSSGKGLQRIIAEKASTIGAPWHDLLCEGFCTSAQACLLREMSYRQVEFWSNFFLLTPGGAARHQLSKLLGEYTIEQLDGFLDPYGNVRKALSHNRSSLIGSWDDHWPASVE